MKGTRMGTLEEQIENAVARALSDRFGHILADLSFRIEQAYELVSRVTGGDRGDVFAEDLKLVGRHMLTGYAVTNNSPSAGSIAWVDLHIVYNGTDYTIANGSTALKYAWWSPTSSSGTLRTSNTKPTLAQGEVLVFMNDGGTHRVMLSETNTSLPGVVSDGAVDSTAILANAVTAAAIANGAVGSDALGSNVVTAAKLANGAVTRADQLGNNVVSTAKIAANAVTTNELGANAVASGNLANGAVNRADQLANGVVGGGKIAEGAVTPTKLKTLQHLLY